MRSSNVSSRRTLSEARANRAAPEPMRGQVRRTANKRQTILDAAARLFAERGYERTSTRALANEAGVAEGTIFTYFPTKRHIIIALLEKVVLQSLKHTLKETAGMSDRDVIYAVVLDRLRLWKEHGDILKAVIAQILFDKPLADAFVAKIVTPALKEVGGFIARRQADGAFRDVDADFAVRLLVSQTIGLGIMNSAAPAEVQIDRQPEEYASRLTDIMLEGIGK